MDRMTGWRMVFLRGSHRNKSGESEDWRVEWSEEGSVVGGEV